MTLNPRIYMLLAPMLLLLAAACSPGSGDPIISSEQKAGGPVFSAVIITSDLAIGRNRLMFGVINRDGMPALGENSEVAAYLLVPNEDARELKASVTAHFVRWPSAPGVFVADIDLDTAGSYEIDVNFTSNEGAPIFAQARFILKETPSTPAIGSLAPPSVTHTAAKADDISHITSSPQPDLDLYEYSIHEALRQEKPLVVVFATPAFCISATCGPQVGELSKVKENIGDRANYIHVEVFENPHLLEGARPAGGLVAAVEEWGLPTEPWTFIIDRQGLIYAKFEQFTTAGEIEAKLLEIL